MDYTISRHYANLPIQGNKVNSNIHLSAAKKQTPLMELSAASEELCQSCQLH